MKTPTKSETGPLALTVGLAVAVALMSVWALMLRSENQRLRAALARVPAATPIDAEPASAPAGAAPAADAPAAAPAPPAGPNRLSDVDRAAMREKLPATTPAGTRAWFAVSSDPEAQALAGDVQQMFRDAGWQVVTRPATFSVRSGVFFFAAEDLPSSIVEDALKALQAVGFAPTVGLGYRSFFEERKRADPNWRGVELDADQSFVIVIGPR